MQAYAGVSCNVAGVPEGKIYEDYDDAVADAAKLSSVNPVGFEVIEVPKKKRFCFVRATEDTRSRECRSMGQLLGYED